MENVNKYPITDDNPPSYDVAVGYNHDPSVVGGGVVGPYYPANNTLAQNNIPPHQHQQYQYNQTPIPTPYAQIPQNYQVVTVVPAQPCILSTGAAGARNNEIPRNIKIISYIGFCVCIFVVIMAIRNHL